MSPVEPAEGASDRSVGPFKEEPAATELSTESATLVADSKGYGDSKTFGTFFEVAHVELIITVPEGWIDSEEKKSFITEIESLFHQAEPIGSMRRSNGEVLHALFVYAGARRPAVPYIEEQTPK